MIDSDKDGNLSQGDLACFLGLEDWNHQYINEMIKKVDDNSDAKIDFEEFSEIMGKIKKAGK